MDMDKYDVFISCKSEDYQYAEEVYDFLVSEGIKTFLASKELRELGESDYREAIEDAMGETTHIIVFASNPEYVRSKWIKYEWGLFVNEKISDRKQGNIVTILNCVEIGDLPIGLRKYQSFPFKKYKEDILKYVETDASKVRKEQILKQKESEYLKLQQQREREEKKKEIKEELIKTSEAYKKTLSSLQFDVNKIYGLLQDLDIKERECPICNQMLPIKETSCRTCGWILSPLDGIKELAYLNKDNEELRNAYKAHYKEFLHWKEEGIDNKELETLKELKAQLEHDLQTAKEENLRLDQELKVSKDQKAKLEDDLELTLEDMAQLQEKLKSSKEEIKRIQDEHSDLKSSYAISQDKVQELDYKTSRLIATVESYKKQINNLNQQIQEKDNEILNYSGKSSSSFSSFYEDADAWNGTYRDKSTNLPSSLSVKVGDYDMELSRVNTPEGDFFITNNEVHVGILLGYRNYGIKLRENELSRVLDALNRKTDFKWDVPSIKEWTTAYKSKSFGKYNSFQTELCFEPTEYGDRELCGIIPPYKYTKVNPSNEYVLHAVIRVKDNPNKF